MFDTIRSHRRWLMLFLVLLVFPSFVATGIYGYNRFMADEQALARVGGEAITPQQFEAAHRERLQQLRQSLGDGFDPSIFDTPAAREASLNALVGDRALRMETASSHVAVSENRLRQVIASVPAFQENGKFSYDRYKTLLASQGMSEAMFEFRMREDLARQSLLDGVGRSALVPSAVTTRLTALLQETRTIREKRFPPEDFQAKVSVDDAAIKTHYDTHRKQFETQENVDVQFLVLTLDDVARGISVPPADLQTYYEQNKSSFSEPEQRRASHVLLTVGEGGSAKDKDGARKLAQELLARVRAKPDEFARLAKEYSKDPGSAANGGDLGFFGRNMMVKPFEDAAFSLKPGDISDLVETEFGVHIIRVTEVKGGAVAPFAQVRGKIEAAYRQREAQKKFSEAAEQFTNLVYEQADSLQPAADTLGLKIQTAANITRDGLPREAPAAAYLTPAAVQALFADDALSKKRNIKAVEVGSSTLVSARIAEHRPARLRPLEEVNSVIREQLRREQAVRLAREAATAAAEAMRKAPAEAGFSPPRSVSRGQPEGLSPDAMNRVMQVEASKLPSFVVSEAGGGVQSVFWVLDSKQPEKPDPQTGLQVRRGVEQQLAAADDQSYIAELKRKYKAQILKSPLAEAKKQ
jgi:peptidyl-prolyl cis-trans isomerase D